MKQDPYWLDKACIRRSFDRAAADYDKSAQLQAEVSQRMQQRLDLIKIDPQQVLDAGCGTGHASQALLKRYPAAQLISLDLAEGMLRQSLHHAPITQKLLRQMGHSRQHPLAADIEHLPLAKESVDLVWSNLALQWCNDLDQAFSEFHRVLRTGGLLSFTTFGPDTLKELRAATQFSPDAPSVSVSRFIDMHDIGDALVRAGFSAPVLDVEHFTLTYDDVMGLMRDLKAIGAHNATLGRAQGLRGKGFLNSLKARYETFRHAGKLPASYEVVYGHAWKPAPKPAAVRDQFVPVEILPRRKP